MDLGFTDVWGEAGERRGLRPLGWSELCARLVAAQDLRRAVRPPGCSPWVAPMAPGKGASFHRPAAEMLLDVAFTNPQARSERDVNLCHSDIGKADSGTFDAVHEALHLIPRDCPTSREKP